MEIKRQRNLLLARASCAAFISASRTLEGGKSVFSHPIEFPYFSETFFHRGRYNQCMYNLLKFVAKKCTSHRFILEKLCIKYLVLEALN